MEAKEFLRKNGIQDRVLNTEDLTEYWKTISQLMEEYHIIKLNQPTVIEDEVVVCNDQWYESNMQHFSICHTCGLKCEY